MEAQSEKTLIQLVTDKYDEVQPDRRHYDEQAIVNYCYYAGRQNLRWNATLSRMQINHRKGRVTRVYNLINPLIQRLLQRYTSRPPQFKGLPATREQQDVWAASVADSVLQYDFHQLDLDGQIGQNVVLSALIFAYSFLKIYWNPKAGRPYKGTGEDGQPVEYPEGDIRCCVRNPLTVAVDPNASLLEDAEWMMEFTLRTPKWVKANYGVDVNEESLDTIGSYQAMLKSYISNLFAIGTERKKDLVMVKEYWEAPSEDFPDGRVITVAQNKLLDYKEQNPYSVFPYVKFGSIPMPDRLQDLSVIQQVKPMQDGYNGARGQIEEWHKRAIPLVFAPVGTIKQKDGALTKPFEIIEYEQGRATPEFKAAPQLTAEAYQFANTFRESFRDVSGMSEVAEGQQLPNVRSADHWMAILEQENQNSGALIKGHMIAWEKVARQIINIEQRFRAVPKLIQITGKYMSHKAVAFSKADLQGNIDVRIVPNSMMPTTFTARYTLGMEIAKSGIWGPMGSPELKMAFYEHLGTGSGFIDPMESDRADRDTAQRENAEMEQGIQPKPPAEWEDHIVHNYQHRGRMKLPDFKDLPPNVIAVYVEHVSLTDMMQAQGQGAPAINMPQIQQQMAAQAGQPPRPQMPIQGATAQPIPQQVMAR
jgi:hypothetical protein